MTKTQHGVLVDLFETERDYPERPWRIPEWRIQTEALDVLVDQGLAEASQSVQRVHDDWRTGEPASERPLAPGYKITEEGKKWVNENPVNDDYWFDEEDEDELHLPARARKTKVLVTHSGYGCESGCCGHLIEIEGGPKHGQTAFCFEHPDSNVEIDKVKFAKRIVEEEFGAEHVADLDWENCVVMECW